MEGWRCCRQAGRGALVLPTAAPHPPLTTDPQAGRRPHSVCPPSEWARPPPSVKSRVMPSKFPGGHAVSCGPQLPHNSKGRSATLDRREAECRADCAPGMWGGRPAHAPSRRWRHRGPQTWVQGQGLSHSHCWNSSPFKRTDLANTSNTNRDEMPPGTRSSFVFQAQKCHVELGHEVTPWTTGQTADSWVY